MDTLLKKEIPGADREIIVIESNSTDGTRELAEQYRGHPDIKLVLQDRPRGKGNAVREGFRHATGDIVLIQDADLEYDLDDYDALLAPILSHRALFVLGTRHGGNWKMRRFATQKTLATGLNLGHAFFAGLINVLFRQNMTDPFTMFKVFRRDCLFGLELQCDRFDFDHELVIKFVRKGYRPLEIPVNYSFAIVSRRQKSALVPRSVHLAMGGFEAAIRACAAKGCRVAALYACRVAVCSPPLLPARNRRAKGGAPATHAAR